jgi:hypothetical protein
MNRYVIYGMDGIDMGGKQRSPVSKRRA